MVWLLNIEQREEELVVKWWWSPNIVSMTIWYKEVSSSLLILLVKCPSPLLIIRVLSSLLGWLPIACMQTTRITAGYAAPLLMTFAWHVNPMFGQNSTRPW